MQQELRDGRAVKQKEPESVSPWSHHTELMSLTPRLLCGRKNVFCSHADHQGLTNYGPQTGSSFMAVS